QLNVLHQAASCSSCYDIRDMSYFCTLPALFSRLKSKTLQNIGQGSKTVICISFTKLNIDRLFERVFLNFLGYLLTVTQMQANATKPFHKFRNRSHFSRDAKRIYEKTYYSHASSVVSTVTLSWRNYSGESTPKGSMCHAN
ncbi:hypothetical protein CSKR_105551, partial [Clonorchis sinensis]